jgi:hypothetical protein
MLRYPGCRVEWLGTLEGAETGRELISQTHDQINVSNAALGTFADRASLRSKQIKHGARKCEFVWTKNRLLQFDF